MREPTTGVEYVSLLSLLAKSINSLTSELFPAPVSPTNETKLGVLGPTVEVESLFAFHPSRKSLRRP